jgi:prepilin-type N-terminal cleavage/methylation domain-containing protein
MSIQHNLLSKNRDIMSRQFYPKSAHIKAGFSLVELSIVVMIIALLIVGVSVGIQLRDQYKKVQLISEYREIQEAFHQFKLKYNAIAGDMPNATSYWPSAVNGDGDFIIDFQNNSNTETYRAWEQLSLSGMITGQYSLVTDTDGYPKAGEAMPLASYKSHDGEGPALWTLNPYQSSGMVALDMTGMVRGGGLEIWHNAHSDAIAPRDLYDLDKKIDDGVRTTGSITGGSGKEDIWSWNSNCVDGGHASGYKITNAGAGCTSTWQVF